MQSTNVNTKGVGTPNRVRELRQQRGWGVHELAHRARLSHGHIGFIETGQRGGTFNARWRICQALGVEYGEAFPPMMEAAYRQELEREAASA